MPCSSASVCVEQEQKLKAANYIPARGEAAGARSPRHVEIGMYCRVAYHGIHASTPTAQSASASRHAGLLIVLSPPPRCGCCFLQSSRCDTGTVRVFAGAAIIENEYLTQPAQKAALLLCCSFLLARSLSWPHPRQLVPAIPARRGVSHRLAEGSPSARHDCSPGRDHL